MHIALLSAAAGLLPALALAFSPAVPRTAPPAIRAGAIEGRVRDGGGTPIAGAHVVVVGTPHAARTDAVGRYRLAGVPAGRHALTASAPGYRTERAEGIAVAHNATTLRDFTLQTAGAERDAIAGRADESRADAVRTEDARGGRQPVAAAPKVGAEGQQSAGQPAGYAHDRRYARRHRPPGEPWNTEDYRRIEDNRFHSVRSTPLSTFSIDVDRASYANVRRFLLEGRLPPADAVRTEELVNYFTYEYAEPRGEHPFTVAADVGPAPWNRAHRLVRIGLQGRRYAARELPPSNLVFLIDVSGSMSSADKLPLVQQAFRLLVNELRDEDRVAIVVYAGSAGLVLPSTRGSDRETILGAIDRLQAGGSTAGGAGIRLAYEIARRNHLPEGNNRVILATDGDFNVGVSSEGELVRLVEEKRRQGTALTVLGFGTGNLKDSRMEQIADKGDGNYSYIDNLLEARKVFVSELTSTLFTIAKDVKIQVEFNPARVQAYRLIGYENRLLANEDFHDDTKDAGELGAGHTVTALYEIVPVGARSGVVIADGEPLRYQQPGIDPVRPHGDEWLSVQLRYKPPQSDRSRLMRHTVRIRDELREASGDFGFAASVAAFGMVLRNSEFRGSATLDDVLDLARATRGADADGYRAEFIRLVEMARTIGVAVRD
jgi:Ca-activated chloride channel family protein